MLNHIPRIICPELMKAMMEMGHGDELCFVDCNFAATANNSRVIRADGLNITDLLEAVLEFFPLDKNVEHPCAVAIAPPELTPKVLPIYEEIISKKDFMKAHSGIDYIEPMDFFSRAQKAFAIVLTGQLEPYSNIIIRKGCIILK